MILDKLYNIIFGEGCVEIGNTSKIFKKKPGLFCGNYFSGKIFFITQEEGICYVVNSEA